MTGAAGEMRPRTFAAWLLAILAAAAVLRGLFPAADPPWRTTVGIVWHDEGAWTHNARNKALWGEWIQDAWNPMYIAPVFTGLEYVSFRFLGVGLGQARLMPALLGVVSVLVISLGVAGLAGHRTGLIAGALLATNYVYVMWNRTAMMEGPMTAFMVVAWYCYARAQREPRWGWVAGICALVAFFTKASAAFFLAALSLDAAATALGLWHADHRGRRAAWATLGGLAVGGVMAVVAFVLPNWSEYRFYNWQMSVTRKPGYGLGDLQNRVSWFATRHTLFGRMWSILVVAAMGALSTLARWRHTDPAERLLVLWLGLGALEVVAHDVSERRFVMLVPPLVAVAAIVLGRERRFASEQVAGLTRRAALLGLPAVGFAAFVAAGALVALLFLNESWLTVRVSAAIAAALAAFVYGTWPLVPRWLSAPRWSVRVAIVVAALLVSADVVQYVQWAASRTYKNYAASVELGRHLPPGTLVHGKLANGLSLENRIRPVFVGRGFGNYDDRKRRDDVRYILTYTAPSLGFESQAGNPVIVEVLEAYPGWRIVQTFDVRETGTGRDQAALIDKFGLPSAKD